MHVQMNIHTDTYYFRHSLDQHNVSTHNMQCVLHVVRSIEGVEKDIESKTCNHFAIIDNGITATTIMCTYTSAF